MSLLLPLFIIFCLQKQICILPQSMCLLKYKNVVLYSTKEKLHF